MKKFIFFPIILFAIWIISNIIRPTDSDDIHISSVQKLLLNRIKACAMISTEKQTNATFADVEQVTKSSMFEITAVEDDNCFKAIAYPKDPKRFTWFEIDNDFETGLLRKVCGDATKTGCKEGNIW